MISELFQQIQLSYFLLSALLFLLGLYLGPMVVERNIRFLLVYPHWIMRLLERYLNKDWPFLALAGSIFLLNNFSLFTSILSGFLVVLPPLAALLTGIHLAVISYEMMGWRGMWEMLINPVAWLEFPASWISFAGGLHISVAVWKSGGSWQAGWLELMRLLPIYLKYVMTLLLLAAIIEAGLIVLARKMGNGSDHPDQ